tara:strand:+ start:44 stop:484 length:441 start_codon:yes stop_codon:yes gene_type:complete
MGGGGVKIKPSCKYTTIILAFAPEKCTLKSYDLKSGLNKTLKWTTKPTEDQLKNLLKKDKEYLGLKKNLESIMKKIEGILKEKKEEETLKYLTMPCIPRGTTKFHLEDTSKDDVYDDFNKVDQQEEPRLISPCTFVLWWQQKFLCV